MKTLLCLIVFGWISYKLYDFLVSDPIEYEERKREEKRKSLLSNTNDKWRKK
jgi:hypothetical protein